MAEYGAFGAANVEKHIRGGAALFPRVEVGAAEQHLAPVAAGPTPG